MVHGLQGEEWKFIQKYLKKRSKRVGAQISQFRTLHGDLQKSRKLISQLGIYFRTLSSKFTSWKITLHVGLHRECTAAIHFKFRTLEFQFRKVRNCPLADAVVFRRPYLPHFNSKSYMVWNVGLLTSWALKMDFGKCSKSEKEDCSCCPLFSSFSLCFSHLLGLS